MSDKIIQLPIGKNVKLKNKQSKVRHEEVDPKIDFLQHVSLMIQYWNGIDDKRLTQQDRLVGVSLSILEALDGKGYQLPQYNLSVKGSNEPINGQLGMLFPIIYEVVAAQVAETLAENGKNKDDD